MARRPEEIARQYELFATKLLSNKQINQEQYQGMMSEVNKILTEQELTARSKNAIKQIAKYTAYASGITGAYATYLGAKYIFGE